MSNKRTIDELETLTPDLLGKLLRGEIQKYSPDFQYIQDILTVGCPVDSINSRGWTALHYAISWRHLEIMKFLLSKGAMLDIKGKYGQTPLHWAAMGIYPELVRFLISVGADVNAVDEKGRTAWDYAYSEIKKTVPELRP